jgi:hypothetical protein
MKTVLVALGAWCDREVRDGCWFVHFAPVQCGRKEPLLGLGHFVEPSRGLFVGSRHAYSPNFIGGLCAILACLEIG